MNQEQKNAKEWFLNLRNDLVIALETIEGKKFKFRPSFRISCYGYMANLLKIEIVTPRN